MGIAEVSADAKPGNKLQSRTPEEYGEKYQDHLLEQYKLFVATSEQVSERRQNADNSTCSPSTLRS